VEQKQQCIRLIATWYYRAVLFHFLDEDMPNKLELIKLGDMK